MSGLGDKISGKAKEVAGQVTGNEKLEAKGNMQQIKGDVEERFDDARENAGEKVNEWLDKVKDKADPDDEDDDFDE